MSAERLLRGNVKPPFRAFAVFATAAVLVAGSAFAQAPHSVLRRRPSLIEELEKSRVAEEKDRKKWSSCKKQARAQKVKLRSWNRFMNDCMAK